MNFLICFCKIRFIMLFNWNLTTINHLNSDKPVDKKIDFSYFIVKMSVIEEVSKLFSKSFCGSLSSLKKCIEDFNAKLSESKLKITYNSGFPNTNLIKSGEFLILQVRWIEGPYGHEELINTIPYSQNKNLKEDIKRMML